MSKVRPLKTQPLKRAPVSHWGQSSRNLVKNLFARDFGLLASTDFISGYNLSRLDGIKLSRSRSVKPLTNSITWFSLDNIDSRYLLAAKSDGTFIGVDTFQERKSPDSSYLDLMLDVKRHKQIHLHSISCIQWYPIDTGLFFTSGMDKVLKLWDTNTLQVVEEYPLEHKIYSHHISTLSPVPGRSLMALALDNGDIRLVDINSGSQTHTIKAHIHGHCGSVQWSSNRPGILASSGSDGRIGIWDVRSSKSCLMYLDSERSKGAASTPTTSISRACTAHSGGVVSLTYTPDSLHLLSLGKDHKLRLWDTFTGCNTLVNYGRVPLSTAANHTTETCVQMSCSSDSTNLVFVPSGANLLMFGMLDGVCKKTLKGHFEPVTCCVYNSALNEVYTGSRDRNILVWDSKKEDEKEEKRAGIGGGVQSTSSVLSSTGRAQTQSDNWSDED